MIDREKVFGKCKDRYFSEYDEGFIWEIVNVVCDEVDQVGKHYGNSK